MEGIEPSHLTASSFTGGFRRSPSLLWPQFLGQALILQLVSSLGVPWTARRSNQSVLKEINPEYSLEGLRLKLKLQYFGYLIQRADSLEKTLMLEKIKTKGEKDRRG